MKTKVGVVIATKGRPHIVPRVVSCLQHQSRLPDTIIVVASDKTDIDRSTLGSDRLEVIFSSPGSSKQRNMGLDLIQSKVDYVVFFDDDFVPSRFWIERLCVFAKTWPDIACISGRVIADGIKGPGFSWSEGEDLVRKQDDKSGAIGPTSYRVVDEQTPYGCNMAFRADIIGDLRMDEKLVLYGWQEDVDFGFQMGRRGRMVWTDFLWGVHLGIKAGRTSGVRFGYSQVMNPLYLTKKGTMSARKATTLVARNVLANCARSIWPDPIVDRPGRLRGNFLGFADLIRGRITPERAERL